MNARARGIPRVSVQRNVTGTTRGEKGREAGAQRFISDRGRDKPASRRDEPVTLHKTSACLRGDREGVESHRLLLLPCVSHCARLSLPVSSLSAESGINNISLSLSWPATPVRLQVSGTAPASRIRDVVATAVSFFPSRSITTLSVRGALARGGWTGTRLCGEHQSASLVIV